MTPRTSLVKTNINNIHSRNYSNQKTLTKYKTYNNYNRMIRLFNPEILDGQYVSQPKKNKQIVSSNSPYYVEYQGIKIGFGKNKEQNNNCKALELYCKDSQSLLSYSLYVLFSPLSCLGIRGPRASVFHNLTS